MADRYAAFLLPVTLLLAGGAWALSGDPVRALAVLVVATPCPLILAAPIALVSGVSRAARVGIIVKGAAAIEQLGRARTVLLDKTGTLTLGAPAVERVVALDGIGPRRAAAPGRVGRPALGRTSWPRRSCTTPRRGGLVLAEARDVHEQPGEGIEGAVEGRRVAVGSRGLAARARRRRRDGAGVATVRAPGRSQVHVGVDGRLAGHRS